MSQVVAAIDWVSQHAKLAANATAWTDGDWKRPDLGGPHLGLGLLGVGHVKRRHVERTHLGRTHLGRRRLERPHLGRTPLGRRRLERPHLGQPVVDRPEHHRGRVADRPPLGRPQAFARAGDQDRQVFVIDIAAEQGDAAIARSIVDLGRHLGLDVVAEGVEDEETWQMLTEMGCTLAQGWHLARPMPAADLPAWLESRRRPAPLLRAV